MKTYSTQKKSVISQLLFIYISTGYTGHPQCEWPENALHATMLQLKEDWNSDSENE